MIIFKTIKWKNFLSTGNHWNEINFLEKNTNLIIGTNGSGKSTMLDALTFALFNKPFRKVNKSQLMNTVNEKDCLAQASNFIPRCVPRRFKKSCEKGYTLALCANEKRVHLWDHSWTPIWIVETEPRFFWTSQTFFGHATAAVLTFHVLCRNQFCS